MSKVKYIATKKIKEILNNNGVSDKGTEFWDLKEELQQELWRRQEKDNAKMIERSINEYNWRAK